jgi:superfamily II DNA or RNA helicase
MKTQISKKGYSIFLNSIKKDELEVLKNQLTVKPIVLSDYDFGEDTTFPVYRLSDTRIYIPKYYGLKKYGTTENKIKDGVIANLEFSGTLKNHQIDFCDKVLIELQKNNSCIAVSSTGSGKCHAINTVILMFDGSIKMVQDIIVGDQLMGDDSTSRNVLVLGSGEDIMYKIIPTSGESFTCNSEHILCLKCTSFKVNYNKSAVKKWRIVWFDNKTIKICSKYFQTEEEANNYQNQFDENSRICEISVKNYLKLSKSLKHVLKIYRTGVQFKSKEIPFDPYMMGFWIGDRHSNGPCITSQDSVVLHYFSNTLSKYGCYLQYTGSQYDYIINGHKNNTNFFLKVLRQLNLINNKHIPDLYKINSREVRLRLLAGLIDSDGHLGKNGCYKFTQKNERIMDDVIFLARSLGFASYKSIKKTSWTYLGIKKFGTAFKTTISGNIEEIPCKIIRKQAKLIQIKNHLVTDFNIIQKPKDKYYGFELDGNGRYLLGDFTVTHNTAMALWLASQFKRRTLILVHKTFLMEQWRERIKQFLPNATIGIIQQNKCEIDKDIVIGMIQSINSREYPEGTFNTHHLTVIDEVQHCSAQGFSNVFFKCNSKFTLGLSANIKRMDGLTKVLDWFLGTVIKNEIMSEVQTPIVKFIEAEYSSVIKPKFNFKGNLNAPNLVNQLVLDPNRNQQILDEIIKLNKEGRKILVLSGRRGHCEYFAKQLSDKKINNGLYLGGMKNIDLEISNKADIVLATYSMASEAYDNPSLDTLIMATGMGSIQQSVGRILRKKNKFRPLVVDFTDILFFGGQARRRKQYYKKNGYEIMKNGYEIMKNGYEKVDNDDDENIELKECLFD